MPTWSTGFLRTLCIAWAVRGTTGAHITAPAQLGSEPPQTSFEDRVAHDVRDLDAIFADLGGSDPFALPTDSPVIDLAPSQATVAGRRRRRHLASPSWADETLSLEVGAPPVSIQMPPNIPSLGPGIAVGEEAANSISPHVALAAGYSPLSAPAVPASQIQALSPALLSAGLADAGLAGLTPLPTSAPSCMPPCQQGRGLCTNGVCLCRSPFIGPVCSEVDLRAMRNARAVGAVGKWAGVHAATVIVSLHIPVPLAAVLWTLATVLSAVSAAVCCRPRKGHRAFSQVAEAGEDENNKHEAWVFMGGKAHRHNKNIPSKGGKQGGSMTSIFGAL